MRHVRDHTRMSASDHGRHLLVALTCVALIGACMAAPRPPAPAAATLAPCGPGTGPGGTGAPPAASSEPASAAEVFTHVTSFPSGDAFDVTAVTWSPVGFVAAGYGPMPGHDFFGLRQGLLWSSCDGMSWQQIVDPAFENISPAAVVAVGADLFVIGELSACSEADEECPEPEFESVILRSSAAGSWERLTLPPEMRLAYLEGAAPLDGRLAVYGAADDETQSGTLWLSTDGATWTSTTDLGGMDQVVAVMPLDGGIVVFGDVFNEDLGDAQLAAATSADGRAFTRVDVPPLLGGMVNSAAAGPAGSVAVGVGYAGDSELALKALALHSTDGLTWSEASATDGSFDGSTLDRVHALPNGYVGVGSVSDDADFTSRSGRIWLSADGRGWRIAGDYGANLTDSETSALGPKGLVILTVDQQETEDGDVINTIGAYYAPLDRLTP
jgi:hypothetical protein